MRVNPIPTSSALYLDTLPVTSNNETMKVFPALLSLVLVLTMLVVPLDLPDLIPHLQSVYAQDTGFGIPGPYTDFGTPQASGPQFGSVFDSILSSSMGPGANLGGITDNMAGLLSGAYGQNLSGSLDNYFANQFNLPNMSNSDSAAPNPVNASATLNTFNQNYGLNTMFNLPRGYTTPPGGSTGTQPGTVGSTGTGGYPGTGYGQQPSGTSQFGQQGQYGQTGRGTGQSPYGAGGQQSGQQARAGQSPYGGATGANLCGSPQYGASSAGGYAGQAGQSGQYNPAGAGQQAGAGGASSGGDWDPNFFLPPGGKYGQVKWMPGNDIDVFVRRGSQIKAPADGQIGPLGQSIPGPMGNIDGLVFSDAQGRTARFVHVQPQGGPRQVRKGEVIATVYDPSMDMLGAYPEMPDGFQHIDLAFASSPGALSYASPGAGGDINGAQFLVSHGYGQQIQGRTKGPPDAMGGGLGGMPGMMPGFGGGGPFGGMMPGGGGGFGFPGMMGPGMGFPGMLPMNILDTVVKPAYAQFGGMGFGGPSSFGSMPGAGGGFPGSMGGGFNPMMMGPGMGIGGPMGMGGMNPMMGMGGPMSTGMMGPGMGAGMNPMFGGGMNPFGGGSSFGSPGGFGSSPYGGGSFGNSASMFTGPMQSAFGGGAGALGAGALSGGGASPCAATGGIPGSGGGLNPSLGSSGGTYGSQQQVGSYGTQTGQSTVPGQPNTNPGNPIYTGGTPGQAPPVVTSQSGGKPTPSPSSPPPCQTTDANSASLFGYKLVSPTCSKNISQSCDTPPSHTGNRAVDFSASCGQQVFAPFSSTYTAQTDPLGNKFCQFTSPAGTFAIYNLNPTKCDGSWVEQGQVIGTVASNSSFENGACNIHFEALPHGLVATNPFCSK